ncbi:DUF1330 domain-containing protein [Swingsia samuiensis]|uniref:DUF1330 domain-containing protein n=1 Tax=Swingsia samuiensis TaxID=1293412 RepID=A0A4Y6UHC6_9PROT|nr:DUF1330 domain-containing protein [Swingsia samuiensis]QDH16434.1 DUF1330 domain-containing protein [Swingsia samuiensis]
MSAYIIFRQNEVTDPVEFKHYTDNVAQTLQGTSAKVLSLYGKHENLEGKETEGVVVLEFPTMDDARAWYHGSAYQNVVKHRWKAASFDVVLVEGV